VKEYKKDDVTVLWDQTKCIHSGMCVKGLPNVFKPKEIPWVKLDNASKIEIVRQVNACPSGALTIKK